jgi:ankyrin repeat protein
MLSWIIASFLAATAIADERQADASTKSAAALADAAEANDLQKLQALLQQKADVNAKQPHGMTALHWAVWHEATPAVGELLRAGADANAATEYGERPLSTACEAGNSGIVELLLKSGADPSLSRAGGETPLMTASRTGNPSVVRLLRQGMDVNAAMQGEKRSRGPNPLVLAVQNGHFETAAAILEAGADPNAQPTGHAALHAITWVRKPVRGDGDPPPVGSGTVSSLQFVRLLVKSGADVNLRLQKGSSGFADFTTTGCTAFVLAAQTGDLPLLNLLLELGADPMIPNADGATAMLAAAGIGDLGSGLEAAGTEEEAIAVIDRLLSLKLDINAVDENGETVVHGAAYQNWPRLIRHLAAQGAKVEVWNQSNRWGWTPLIIAQSQRRQNAEISGWRVGW